MIDEQFRLDKHVTLKKEKKRKEKCVLIECQEDFPQPL